MTNTTNQNPVETFDLGLAAALISDNHKLINLKRTAQNKVQFIFLFTDCIKKATDDYWSDNLRVNARTYFDNIKMLKNRIYTS